MNVNQLKQKLQSANVEERLGGLRDAIAESEALAVYVIKDYIGHEKDETIISAMIIACAKIGGESEIDFIGSYLKSPNLKVKKYAFHALTLIDSPKSYPYIFRVLTDDNDVRFKQIAIKAIRDIGKKESLEIIERMLSSEIEWHRQVALSVLEMLNNILFENELIDILVRSIFSSKSDYCKESLLRLKKICDSGSEYAAACFDKLKKSESEPLRKAMTEACGEVAAHNKSSGTITAEAPKIQAESPPPEIKEETVITEFSDYVDKKIKKPIKAAGGVQKEKPDGGESAAAGFIKSALSRLYSIFIGWPLKTTYRFRYQISALLVMLLLSYVYIFPEIILGKGLFCEMSSKEQENIEAYLAGKGYVVSKGNGNSLPLYRHKFWSESVPVIGGLFGKAIIFSAYEVNLKNTEIFEGVARLDSNGNVRGVDGVKNISQTQSADENELIAMKNSFAYLSSAEGGIKILTIEDGDYTNKRQFLFKTAVSINKIENSALAFNLLRVETKNGQGKTNVSLNVDSGCIDPPDFPIEYIPNVDADEPLLPRIVEKVRNLGFVGPEKIARLEDFYYQTTDYFKRKFYGGEEETARGDEDAPEAKTEVQVAAAIKNENETMREIDSGKFNEDILKTAGINILKNELSGYAFLGNKLASSSKTAYDSLSSLKVKNVTASTMAVELSKSTSEVAMISADDTAPAAITPIFKKTAMKDEGVWATTEITTADGKCSVYKTQIRPDLKRPFATMYIASFDINKFDFKLVPGSEEPVSSIGLKGKGVIPDDEGTYQNLACAFNGGFRSKHGKWGFIAEGVTYLSPVDGIATIAVNSKGNIAMGTWGLSIDTKENYVFLRQNLPPILEDGKTNTTNKYWGASIDNKTNVWRSAIGWTKDRKRIVYGAGNSLSFDTLANGMAMAGCDYAMQLDINDYHTYFFLYSPDGLDKKGKPKFKVKRLTNEMSGDTQRCLKPYTRDFFYVTWKAGQNVNKTIQTASNNQR